MPNRCKYLITKIPTKDDPIESYIKSEEFTVVDMKTNKVIRKPEELTNPQNKKSQPDSELSK